MLLDRRAAAAHLGLTLTTVATYRRLGRFPEADLVVGGKPMWMVGTLDAWQAARWAAAAARGFNPPGRASGGG